MKRKTLLFYCAVTLCMLPILLLRDFTPSNELRYLSIADEALRQGHVFVFYHHGVPYADKPPLFLWALMAYKWVMGHYRGVVLLLCVLPAYGVTELTACTMQLEGKRRTIFRLMMLTCALPLVSMLTLRMDMLFCLFIMLSLRSLHRLFQGDRKESWLLPVWLFLGVFTKGGLGLAIPLATSIAVLTVSGKLGSFFHYFSWKV